MRLSEFAAITQKIIKDQGFAEFLPIVCFPERREIRALEEVPNDANVEAIAIEWANEISRPGEELLVAFKCAESKFKIMRFGGDQSEQGIFVVE